MMKLVLDFWGWMWYNGFDDWDRNEDIGEQAMRDKPIDHTPGPWLRIADPQCRTPINAGPKHIAQVAYYSSDNEMYDITGDEHNANAILIAASPKLYAVARWLVNTPADTIERGHAIADLRDVIDELEEAAE